MIKKGTRVRIKDSEIDSFVKAASDKMRGRIGLVTGRTYPGEMRAVVVFPAVGRRKEYRAGQLMDAWLDIVEDKEAQQ